MKPFDRRWIPLDRHVPAGCDALKNEHFLLSNTPTIPSCPGLDGCVVLIAGKERIGGKSVLSHKILHEYGAGKLCGVNFYPVDIELADKQEKKTAADDDRYCLRYTVKKAHIAENLIDADEAESILREEDWRFMNESFRKALEQNAAIVRMPKPDESLTPAAIAEYLKFYAGSARLLGRSMYLYEYSYADDDNWQILRDSLEHERLDNVLIIEAPLLLVDDAMRFISEHITRCEGDPAIISPDRTKEFLEDQVITGTGGLEIDIGGVRFVMHEAFQRCETSGNQRLLHRYIVEEYTRYMTFRKALRRRPESGHE